MEELYKNIASLNWWIGVVIVGIVVNIMSAYAKAPIDSVLSHLSLRWDRRSQEARTLREEQVRKLRGDRDEQMLLIALETRYRIASLLNVLGSLFALIVNLTIKVATTGGHGAVSSPFAYWASKAVIVLGVCMIFEATRNLARANRCASVVREARA